MANSFKRFLSIALSVLMVVAMFHASVLAVENEADLVISDEAGLKAFADAVNSGTTYAGDTVTLGNDIALTGEWTPIGNGTRSGNTYTGNAFKGTFDGAGKKISGLTITATTGKNAALGLFGVVDGGTVKNFELDNVNINVSTSECAGGAIGILTGDGTADQITVSGSVSAARGNGGIVGRMLKGGTISNCENNAELTATGGANVGGIVSAAYYTETGKTMTIINCTNNGIITGSSSGVGGIVGLSAANVTNCTNNAVVTGNGTSIGGVVGEQQNYGSVVGCKNLAEKVVNQTSGYGTGGIIGWVRYNGAAADYPLKGIVEVKDNANSAYVTGGNDAGGIVGTVYNAAVVSGNENTAAKLEATGFAAGIVANVQFAETPIQGTSEDSVVIPQQTVTITDNTSTTTLENMTANCKNLYAYDNSSGSQDGEIGDNEIVVATYDQLVAALADEAVESIKLTADIVAPDKAVLTIVNKTLDLGGKTLTLNGESGKLEDSTIKNGTIEITTYDGDTVADGVFDVYGATIEGVKFYSEKSAVYAVLDIKSGDVVMNNCIIDMDNNNAAGGLIYFNGGNKLTMNVCTVTCTDIGDFISNGIVEMNECSVTLNGAVAGGLDNGINGAALTLNNTNVAIDGATGRGITTDGDDIAITGTSVVKLTNCAEGGIRYKASATITVEDTAFLSSTVKVDSAATAAKINETTVAATGDELPTVTAASGAVTVREPWNGVTIASKEDLYAFAEAVNAGDNYSGKTVTLTADINLAGEEWTPIGYKGATFKGTFNGGNHTISNLKITKTLTNSVENNGIGLFGRTDSPAVIKNLTIENVDITGSLYVGAIVGLGHTGKSIENCTVKGNIAIDAWWYAGVIGGNGYMGLVNNCHVIGNDGSYIKGNNGSYIGGIWGFRGEGDNKITNCSVTNLDITGVDRVGGICGIGHYGNTISGCEADNVAVQATDSEATTVGLIVGACQGTADQPAVFENNTLTDTTAKVGDKEVTDLYGTTIDGTAPVTNYAAKIGDVYYETLAEALEAVTKDDTLTLLADAAIASKIDVKANLTIDGNDHSLTYTGVDRAIDVTKETNGANLTIKNLTLEFTSGYSERGINYNTTGALTLENVTVNGTNVTYAVNLPGKAVGATVTINNSKLSGRIALNVWGKDATINVTNTALTSVDKTDVENYAAVKLCSDGTTSAEGSVINITGGSITALDEKGDPSSATTNATETGKINISESTVVTGNYGELIAIVDYGATSFYGFTALQAAIDKAAEDTTGKASVVLIKDIELTESVTVAAGQTVVIDLNGHKITSDISTIVVEGGNLTVKDSGNTGKIITSDTTGSYEAVAVKSAGTFTLESGTVESGKFGIYIYSSGGAVVINGGTVTVDGANDDGMLVAVGNDADKLGTLEVTGGTFTANGVNYPMYAWDGTIEITGGTFDFAPSMDYIPVGSIAVNNGDGTYTVKSVGPMIFVDGTGYYTLADAFAAASENDEITITEAGNYVWPGTAIPAGVTVKGTVEGVVATSDGTTTINATTLTVENIDFSAINKAAFVGNGKASELTFTDCSFTGLYAFHVDSAAAGAKLTFNNCVFNGFTTFATTVGTIDVNDGEINGAFIFRQNATLDDVTISEDAALQLGTTDTVTGINVTITNCTVADTNGDGSTPSVADKVNGNNAGSSSVKVDGDIVYGAVAKIGDVYYETLAEALAAAKSGETVKLTANATENMVAVTDGVTLDLNGYTLTANYVFGVKTANVVDSTDAGMLIVSQNNIVLSDTNTMVPAWNGTGYIFYDAQIVDNGSGMGVELDEANDQLTFKFVTFFGDKLSDPINSLLTDNGAEDNDLSVVVRLEWETDNGIAYQSFVFNNDQVKTVVAADGGAAFKLTVNGYKGIEGLKLSAMILSETGAELVGTEYQINQ